jgi:iron complex outermembrane receptor protein
MLNVFQQRNVPQKSVGKQDYKSPPSGYTLVKINSSFKIHVRKQPVIIGLSVRNLLNKTYRDYMNIMRYFSDEMGRNVSVRMNVIL